MTVSGNGTATLSDVRDCANEMGAYVRDPGNWLAEAAPKVKYNFTNFLYPDHPLFANLTGCARQFIDTPDHLMTLYGVGWVCPSTIGAVYGAAAGLQAAMSLAGLGVALVLGYAVLLLG